MTMVIPWFVTISGVMCSGKTTLARGLARVLGWSYIPESVPATRYLNDLFTNPSRWAFETQTAFLVHKASQLLDALNRNQDIILDRSLNEDIEIFAQYFYDRGDIDERSYDTYSAIARYFHSAIPEPHLVILCESPFEVVKQRIQSTGREFQKLYPVDHINQIYTLYKDWISRYKQSMIYCIDTSVVDTRKTEIIQEITGEVLTILEQLKGPSPQVELFDSVFQHDEHKQSIRYLKPVFITKNSVVTPQNFPSSFHRAVKVTHYPSAYLAAPFTAEAEAMKSDQNHLIYLEPLHGRLRTKYRRMLTAIGRALTKIGIFVVIPHRDINKWGKRKLSPNKILEFCTEYVKQTDIFIGILGLSHGSHYEFGLARGFRKPVVIINCEEIPRSFISSGLTDASEDILVLKCRNMSQIPSLLLEQRTIDFLTRYIPLKQESNK